MQDTKQAKPKKDWSQLFARHIPTPMERLQGLGYGVASGAAQAMGGTVEAFGLITEQGAKALGQGETPFSEGVQSFGRSISALPEGMRPKKQRAAEGLGVEAAQAVGSGLGFAAQTLAGGGLLRLARFAPQAAAWVAGGGTGILGNFASGYNDALAETGNREAAGWAYQQALDRGESPQQAMIAYGDVLRQTGDRTKALQSGWLNGTISGPFEVIGLGGVVGKVLGNADDATGGSISKAILKMVTEEGGQEGFAQLVENVGAYLVEYDEDRALFEGVAKSTALGGLAGGIVGGPLEVAQRLMNAKQSGPSGDPGDVQGPPSEGRAVLRPEDAQVATAAMLKEQGLALEAKPASAATEEEREAAAYFERRGGQAVFVDQPADGAKVHPAYYHRPTRTAVFARGGSEGSIRKRFRIHEMGHHLAEVSRGHWQELGKALTELDPQGVAEQREAIRPDYEGLTPEAFEEEVVTTYLEDRGGLLLEGDKFEALARKPGLMRTVVDAIIRQLNRIPGIKIEERTTAALRRLRDQLAETDLERGIDPTLLPAMSATVRAGLDAIVGRAQPAQQAPSTTNPAPIDAVAPTQGGAQVVRTSDAPAPGKPAQGSPVAVSAPQGGAQVVRTKPDPQAVRAQRKEREARKADLAASIYKAAGKPEKASQMAQEAARRRGPQRGESARRAQPTRAQAAVEAYEAGAEGGFAVDRPWYAERMLAEGKTPGRMFNDVDMARPGMAEMLASDPTVRWLEKTNPALAARAKRGDITSAEFEQARRQASEGGFAKQRRDPSVIAAELDAARARAKQLQDDYTRMEKGPRELWPEVRVAAEMRRNAQAARREVTRLEKEAAAAEAAAAQPGQRVAASMPERVKARLSQMAELERPRQNFTLAAAVGFGSGAPRNATHAAYLSLPYEAQAAVTSEVASEAVEMVAKLINADLVVGSEGPGGWKNFPAEPSISMKLAGSRNLAEDAAAALGYLLEQSAVYVENVSPNGDTVFVDITGPGLDSYDTLRRFWDSLVEAAPELATGYHPIEAGLRTMRPTGESKADLSRFLRIADTVARKHGLDLSLRDGRAFTTQLDNDWTENPDGRSYLSRLVRRFGPGVQAGLADRRRRLDGALAASIARHQPAGATAGSSDGAFAFWRRTGRLPAGIRGDVVLGRAAGRNRVSFADALSGQLELAPGDFASVHENYTERAKPRESDLGVGKPARTLSEIGQAIINSPYIERHQALVVRDGVVVAHAVGALGTPDAAFVIVGPALKKAFARGSFREGDVLVFAHNHPSGGFNPSDADVASAERLSAEAQQMFGVPQWRITHVVVGYGRATEFGANRGLFGLEGNMPDPAWGRAPASMHITSPSALRDALRNARPAAGTFVIMGTNNSARPVGLVAFGVEEAGQPDFDERMHEALIHMGAARGFALIHPMDRSLPAQLPQNVQDFVVVGEERTLYRGGMQRNRMFDYVAGKGAPTEPLIPAGAFAVTRTPEFQRWFGDSKVVDEKGAPRVVYHGTGAAGGLVQFDPRLTGIGNDQLGSGFYFTSAPDTAANYAVRRSDRDTQKPGGEETPGTLPVFLAIRNPIVVTGANLNDANYKITLAQAEKILRRAPDIMVPDESPITNWHDTSAGVKPWMIRDVAKKYTGASMIAMEGDFFRRDAAAFRAAVRDATGYDGVVHRLPSGEVHYVAWFPEQIKSALGNRGTFSGQNSDIRFAVPPERRQAARERVRALQQQAFAEGEGTSIGNDPAPVRAKPTADPQERAMWRGVDAWRDENDRLIRISHDEQEERAERGLRDARQSTEAAIRGALSDGDAGRILEPWEMVAAAKLVQERMRDAFQAAPGSARDAAYSDALELADAVRANRARTAQALGIFQDALSSPREQLVDAITAPQAEGARKMREQREKAKRGATLTERERARKELEKVQRTEAAKARKIADALQKAGLHPEQLPESELADLEVQAEIMRVASSSVSSATSKLKEWRYASMLSAPLTHKANVVGNAIYNAIGHVERVAEAAVNLAVRAPDAAQAGELVPYFTSFFQSFGKAGSNFMRSWRTERDAWEMHLQETGRAQAEGVRLDLWGGPAIPGKLGRVVRASLRSLKAEDAFFKTLVGLPEAQAQAYRVAHSEGKRGRDLTLRMQEILADPAHSIWSKVQEEVLRRTFQKPGDPQGDMADKILWLLLRARTAVPGGDFALPFVTTPFRIFQEAFGLAFAPGILAGKAVVWPKTYGKNKAQLARDTARALLSSAVGLALLSMLNGEDDEGRPLVTGTRPSSRGEADLAYRTVPPYHIKVLGEYRDYSRLEPLATILASLVDTAKAAKDDPVRAMPAFFRSVYEQMGDKTFLQTIGDVQDALERPSGRAGVELVRDTFITPMFPNIARQTARELDPFFRQEEVWPMDRKATSTARAAVESLPYAILPARGIAPPIRFDLWGRPSQKFDSNVSPLGRYVAKIVNPFPGSTLPEVHALDRVISRFNERVDAGELVGMDDTVGKHFSKTAPDTTTTVAGQPVFFTPTEYARLQEVAGKRSSERLLELLQQRRIDAENPTERDMDIIDKVVNQSRQQVRSEILAARGLPVARLKPANKER